ncbi:uncharacterized protein LOC116410219 [Xenopus tropicalis]|uniref:Gypsy retrotransposon integrase-like protein 1 n=1 Tax=Xenopus tropicalis TaxID=8364 RepID=A0A8J1JHN6_XENTR|nr:uncharacterized protein LOC116410219 [Xenopus tropicalis]
MAAFYKRQTKETLINLCEQRGIDAADKSKEMLVCALVEQEQQSYTPESGDYATQDMPVLNSAPGSSQRGDSNSCSGQGDRNSSLQAALQLLGSDDPQLRLQLILQYQQAEAGREAAEREAAAAAVAAEREAAAAAAERQAERQYQLELAKLQQQRLPPRSSESSELRPLITSADKFPVMDKDGDLDTFLRCFERACRQYHLPREQWAKYLTPGLKGKALDAFVDLPPEFDGDYDAIKNALIKKYHLTPEVYRKKFRTVQRGPTDSYSDVVSSLRTTFKAWLRGLSVTTFDCLEDLMIKDQFLHTCPVEVRQFIMDREPKTADQAAEIADTYAANRMSDNHKTTSQTWKGGKPTGHFPSHASKVPASPTPRPTAGTSPPVDTRQCFVCRKVGHVSINCPEKRKSALMGKQTSSSPAVLFVAGKEGNSVDNLQPVTVGNKITVGLRDTGAEVTLVRPEMVNSEDIIPGKTMDVKGIGGTSPAVPLARVYLDWGAGSGIREVGVSDAIPTNVLLGTDLGRLVSQYVPATASQESVPLSETSEHLKVLCYDSVQSGSLGNEHRGATECPSVTQVSNMSSEPIRNVGRGGCNVDCSVAVVTRSMAAQPLPADLGEEVNTSTFPCSETEHIESNDPLPVISVSLCPESTASSSDFEAALKTDASLEKLRSLADKPPTENDSEKIYWDKGKLYRKVIPSDPSEPWMAETQLIVPFNYREQLLKVAHEVPLAGHLGVQKTKARLTHRFYWPNMGTDIANYCRSCLTCQRLGKSGDIAKAPLIPLPIIDEPFQRVAVDIVGPLAIPSSSGKRFILTVVDYATRYPEAVALSSIRADKVADALLSIFSRVGFPREMLTDHGTQFMSSLMQSLCKKVQVEHLVASPYHPQTNGLCERFNGTLKQMLRMFVDSQGRDWERYLPYLLFAYREVPQASTGFSPFELLYGRRVRGPLDLIREAWEGKNVGPEISVVDYVTTFRDKMQTLMGLVHENMKQAQKTQKQWYDRNARERVYEVGQKVWVLIPMRQNKLQAAWEGPCIIQKRLNDVTYVVAMDEKGQRQKIFHVNMIKAHYDRTACALPVCSLPTEGEVDSLVDLLASTKDPGSFADAQINPQLTEGQKAELSEVLESYQQTFSAKPGRTHLVAHHVNTGSHSPIRQSAYRVSLEVQADIKREIEEMLTLDVIQKSHSAWASPVVLVPKKDKSTRFCVDYRKLNAITVFDAYPMPRMDELLDKLAGACFLTIMDLSRGYWQIPLTSDAQERSAFVTPFGLFEFKVMPFGMKNAPATFQRVVNGLLEGMEQFALAYLDDIAVFSHTWKDHLSHLSQVLGKIKTAGLTIKPGKCQIGMTEVQYLGHRVGGGTLRPDTGKVDSIMAWPTPQTKKQVMSFLGTAGYYRKFVPNYSSLAKPLTDLTKKKLPKVILWTPDCENSFLALKNALVNSPVLQAPDFTRRFVVQTDASAYGLGAVLSQVNQSGEEHPILYLSRKLLPREVAYATIEKECLAIVWALQKLQPYLYGRNFTVITDHNPLSWLTRMAGDNGKLLRWSLTLQQYDFTIQHKKGSDHGNADGLSRQSEPFQHEHGADDL